MNINFSDALAIRWAVREQISQQLASRKRWLRKGLPTLAAAEWDRARESAALLNTLCRSVNIECGRIKEAA